MSFAYTQKHKLAAWGIVCESARSVNRFGIPATDRLPADSTSCCRRCKRKMHWEKKYLSLRQRRETKERVEIAEYLGGFARKRSARGRGGREFASDNPRQNFSPILRRGGPAGVFCPFPLHRRVPVAFVTPAEALLLLCDPAGIRVYARLGNHCECGLFAFSARIDAEARRDRLHRQANIQLTGFPFTGCRNGKLQVHVRFVKRLVLRETDIPVDP